MASDERNEERLVEAIHNARILAMSNDEDRCICCASSENLFHVSFPDIFPDIAPFNVCWECREDGSLQKWLMDQIIRDNPELKI
jgi:hypothetical protein